MDMVKLAESLAFNRPVLEQKCGGTRNVIDCLNDPFFLSEVERFCKKYPAKSNSNGGDK